MSFQLPVARGPFTDLVNQVGALIAAVRFTYPKVPRQLRQLPKTIYLWDMRRRMAKTGSFAA
jgi:uncharacterized protein (DUF2236 family)